MTAHALDTLAVAGRLKAAGFSDQQAEAMTFVLRDASELGLSGAATKADLLAVQTDLQAMRTELKSDIQTLKSEMKSEIASVRSDVQALDLRVEARIEAGKSETIKWVVSAIGFQTLVLLGAIIAVVRLFQT